MTYDNLDVSYKLDHPSAMVVLAHWVLFERVFCESPTCSRIQLNDSWQSHWSLVYTDEQWYLAFFGNPDKFTAGLSCMTIIGDLVLLFQPKSVVSVPITLHHREMVAE